MYTVNCTVQTVHYILTTMYTMHNISIPNTRNIYVFGIVCVLHVRYCLLHRYTEGEPGCQIGLSQGVNIYIYVCVCMFVRIYIAYWMN